MALFDDPVSWLQRLSEMAETSHGTKSALEDSAKLSESIPEQSDDCVKVAGALLAEVAMSTTRVPPLGHVRPNPVRITRPFFCRSSLAVHPPARGRLLMCAVYVRK